MPKEITKHPGGRPTKYIPSTIFPKIEEYLEGCSKEQTELPTVEGLAAKLEVTSETIRQWADKYPEFSLTIKKLADKQKNQLINDGMYGGKEVNASMAIFLLKAIHGFKDQPDTNINISVKPILGGASVVSAEVVNVPEDDSNKQIT